MLTNTLVRPDVFEKTYKELGELRSTLSEDAVAALASEVIVRLSAHMRERQPETPEPSPEQIEALTRALISDDADAGSRLVHEAVDAGMDVEKVCLVYLSGAARLLGEWWETDRASFLEVAVGTGRIYSILRAANHLFVPRKRHGRKSAVFASAPNETHTLGVRMAADLFRKEGWNIDLQTGLSHDELVDYISRSNHCLIGLSAAGRHSSARLAKLIVALRISKPFAYIMVSGQIVNDAEDIVSVLGADGAAADFETAHAVIEEFWDRLEPSEQRL